MTDYRKYRMNGLHGHSICLHLRDGEASRLIDGCPDKFVNLYVSTSDGNAIAVVPLSVEQVIHLSDLLRGRAMDPEPTTFPMREAT